MNLYKVTHAFRSGAPVAALMTIVITAGMASANISQEPSRSVLTLDEASTFLRIDAGTLKDLAQKNEVPSRKIGAAWRFNRDALLAWLNGDWQMIAKIIPAPPAPTLNLSHIVGAGIGGVQVTKNPGDSKDEPIGEAPKEKTAEDTFLRDQKVLLGKGDVAVDFGVFYARSDARALTAVDGGIGLTTVEQDTFTTLLQGRVGVFDETEFIASTTFRRQESDLFFGSRKLIDTSVSEFGDLRFGIRHTLLKEASGHPDVIVSLDGRVPTGDTSYAIGVGMSLVKSIDPVVLFSSMNYRHTFSRDFTDVTRLEAPDRLDATVGYALALNDNLTISAAVSGQFSSAETFRNAKLRRRDDFSLQLGLTSWLSEGLYVEPTVSFGLNGPGDRFALGVTFPYSF